MDQSEKGSLSQKPAVTVTTAATAILAANPNRKSAMIYNNDAAVTVYLGDAGVTALTGMPLLAGNVAIDNDSIGPIYGITSASTANVRSNEVD